MPCKMPESAPHSRTYRPWRGPLFSFFSLPSSGAKSLAFQKGWGNCDARSQRSAGDARSKASCALAVQSGVGPGVGLFKKVWRPRPELNRGTRICSPLRHHSATWPQRSVSGAPPHFALSKADRFTDANGRLTYSSDTLQAVMAITVPCDGFPVALWVLLAYRMF